MALFFHSKVIAVGSMISSAPGYTVWHHQAIGNLVEVDVLARRVLSRKLGSTMPSSNEAALV